MLTLLLIFWPLLATVGFFAIKPSEAKKWAIVASVIELVISLVILMIFDPSEPAQFVVSHPWIRSLGINFHIGIDGISMLLVLLTTVLTPLIILSSFKHQYENAPSFYGLVLFMEMALIGVFCALDGFLFYIFWEMALIPIYFICLRWGGVNRGPVTLKFFIYTLAGSLIMLVGLIYVYFQTPGTHSFDLEAIYAAGQNLPASEQGIIFWALFVAFAVKMPVFPFHTWQPDTYHAAPSPGTMLLSGIMLKMGIYGVIRWLIPVVPDGVERWGSTALTLSVIGIVYGALVALVQPDVKKLVAYSSVSHLGFVMLGIWAATLQSVQGALLIMIGHGLSTGALFLLIGMLYERRHTREIAAFGGLARVIPIFSLLLVVTSLASIGLPGLNGFVGEFLVLVGSFERFPWATGIATTGVICAAAYLLWALQRIIFNRLDRPENAHLSDLSARELWVVLPLVAGMVWLGLYPRPVLDRMDAAARHYIQLVQPGRDKAPATALNRSGAERPQ